MTKIHPSSIVDENANIDSTVEIGPFSVIGPLVTIGPNCKIHSHVVIEGRTTIGADCEIFSFASLGKAPQHLRYAGEDSELIIGHNNIIREHVTMHKGTQIDNMKTVIGNHGLFMASSHVAHDCIVGDHFILAQNAALGGHCKVADNVYFGAYSAAHQNVRIGHGAMIGGLTAVIDDVIPFGCLVGERAKLQGLNVIGMRRRGMEKSDVREINKAFQDLFKGDGSFAENLAKIKTDYAGNDAVSDIIRFIEEGGTRALSQA